jgi:hypothetical protein
MGSEVAEKPPWAVSERGTPIQHTEAEVDAALRLLVANGGKTTTTAKQLTEEGLTIGEEQLRKWRDRSFPRRYMQLRTEMGLEVAEKIAGSALERAMEADQAEAVYIAEAVAKVKEVDPNHLAKNALALANAKGSNIEKAQLLRNMPTQITKVDLGESIGVLERLGVVEKAEVIDAEVVEEEDA